MKAKILFTASLTGLILLACTKDKTEVPACPDVISYQQDVAPIMEVNCTTSGCHDVSAAGGYDLTTYSSVATAADQISTAINHLGGSPMPQGADKLPDSTIQKFDCWVSQGKLDN